MENRFPADAIKAGSPTDALRIPPHSVESEQSLLGGLMLDNEAWAQIADAVVEQDFYRRDHQLIFRAISSLANGGKPFDALTVAEWLENHGDLEEAGGLPLVNSLPDNTPTAANIAAYAEVVRHRSVLRQLLHACGVISGNVFNRQGRSTGEILDQAEQSIFGIGEQLQRARALYGKMSELVVRALDRIDELYTAQSPITGISTGYARLDELTSGLQHADLVVIAGRPSMGKTSLALCIAEHAAIKEELSVAVFSMEMSGSQLAMRMLSSLGRIDQLKVRSGKLSEDDWPRLTSAVQILSGIKMFVDDTGALTPADVRARSRRIKRDHGLDLVIVDYLQLMQVPNTTENRATEISEISRSLKALAKELNIPVIALSQLNRSLESRPDKRPVMSDLRESGAIEQDADLIMFIYRDEVYHEDTDQKGIAEIIIGKQRNGPIGTVKLSFLGQFTRFENLAHGDYGS